MFKVVFPALVGVASYGVYYLVRSGIFHDFRIKTGRFATEEEFMLRTVKGPYSNVGLEFKKLLKLMDKMSGSPMNQPGSQVVGVYHDDPFLVAESDIRSSVGVALGSFSNPEEVRKYLQAEGYRSARIPSFASLYCEYPFTGFISVMISIWKLYGFDQSKGGKLVKYLKEHPDVDQFAPYIAVTTSDTEIVYFPLEDIAKSFEKVLA